VWDCVFSADSAYLVTGMRCASATQEMLLILLVYCIVLYCIVLYCIVLYKYVYADSYVLFLFLCSHGPASSDASARLWDLSTGDTIRTYTGHLKAVVTVALNDSTPDV